MTEKKIKTLFLDIGGVLLTNGWDTGSREKAVKHFGLDMDEVETRHKLSFDTFELGKMSMDQYLDITVFYKPQKFPKEDFIKFMFDESKPLAGSMAYFKQLKDQHRLKVIALSNEANELNEHRIKKYELNGLFDAYISSCYVGLRKPDAAIYQMAINVSQTPAEKALYIDDRDIFVEVARSIGIPSLQYKNLEQVKGHFDSLGMTIK
jgi:putative hydrolase of the HAD superfamily